MLILVQFCHNWKVAFLALMSAAVAVKTLVVLGCETCSSSTSSSSLFVYLKDSLILI